MSWLKPWLTEKRCANKKVPFSQIDISLLANFGSLFLKKNGFLDKNHYLAKRKNGRLSVIPAGTSSVVSVGHFFVAPTVPPSFVDNSAKLRLLILAK